MYELKGNDLNSCILIRNRVININLRCKLIGYTIQFFLKGSDKLEVFRLQIVR